jgi:putative ABC transport system substrate-binding protein
MRRRNVLAGLGGVLAWPYLARGQSQHLPTIGYLGSETPDRFESRLAAFRRGLAQAGYQEGRNVRIEFRWAHGRYDHLPALAAELANQPLSVIVAPGGAEVVLAAKSATTTVPIVFEMGGDPVALGIVSNLSRPGGNLTGVSSLSVEVSLKRLELMHELMPRVQAFTIVANPTSPTVSRQLKSLSEAAASLGLKIRVLEASTESELQAVFEQHSRVSSGGLVFTSDPFFAYRSQNLAALAAANRVPTITQSRDFPLAGGLMSYGGDFQQSHWQAGMYAGRVLKGEKIADLPVHLVTRLEFVVNLKSAGALGLTFPPTLLSSADTMVE